MMTRQVYVSITAMLCLVSSAPAGRIDGYSIAELRPLPRGSFTDVTSISQRSQVAGVSSTWRGFSPRRAVLWDRGFPIELPVPNGGRGSFGEGVNVHGDVAGYAEVDYSIYRGFVWRGGRCTILGTFGGDDSHARDINDSGTVVGSAANSSRDGRAFRWDGGDLIELAAPVGDSSAQAINNDGIIVGTAEVGGQRPRTHAVLWNDTGMVDLGALEGPTGLSWATDLNDLNQVVGSSTVDGLEHAFLWQNGEMMDLGKLPGDDESAALGINNHGDIVGWSVVEDGVVTGVLWRGGKIHRLLDLIPSGPEWLRLSAYDINDAGHVACEGWSRGKARTVLVTPYRCRQVRGIQGVCSPNGNIRAKLRSGMPENTVLHITANGVDEQVVFLDEHGRARVKWANRSGSNKLCVAECPDICIETECGD